MRNPKITPTMREMAIAILEGDFEAGLALRDAIEECRDAKPVLPVKRIKDLNNIRIIMRGKFSEAPSDEQFRDIENVVMDWLRANSSYPLFISDDWEISIYEIETKYQVVSENVEGPEVTFSEEIEKVTLEEPKGLPLPITHSNIEFTTRNIEDSKLSRAELLKGYSDTILKK